MSALSELLEDVPEALIHEVMVLLRVIMLSDSPSDAVMKAQKAILADAADNATDAMLGRLLDKGVGR